jgi:ferric-dicitrate binding protein FerR (iron transport regulator)
MEPNLSIDNLLPDETFVRYCLGTADAAERQYWLAFIKKHPDSLQQIEQAKKLILAKHGWGAQDELKEEEEQLLKQIHAGEKKALMQSLFRKISVAVILPGILWCGYLIKRHNELTTFISVRTGVGEIRKISFSDGSSVWLNSKSSIKYAKYFQHFRKVILEEGEIFCEVRHNESSPFSVTTATGMTVNDIGTSFSIRSYGVLQEEQVNVLEGEVAVNELHLKQGRGIRFFSSEPGRMAMHKVDRAEMEWRKGSVVLNNVDLRTVLLTLENAYGMRILVKNNGLMNCPVTISFNTADKIENILNELQQIYGISNVINQDKIMLDDSGILQ